MCTDQICERVSGDLKNPLISVVIPVYKAEKYLDKCITSVVSQTYKNLEIILVDDGSPDRCGELCDKWAEKDDRIKVIHKENGGAADAKNAGLKEIKGEFFGIVDSDDFIAPDMYEYLYNLIVKYGADIADSQICKVDSFEEAERADRGSDTVTEYTAEEALSELMNDRKIRQTPCNKLYRSSTAEGIFFVKGKYIDDEYWTYKVIGNCGKYVFTERYCYYYLQHGESAMGRAYSLKRLDAIGAVEERIVYLREKFPSLEARGIASFVGACRYHHQMLTYHKKLDPDKKYRKELFAKVKSVDMKKVKAFYHGKHRLWLDAFLIAPDLTSKVRNKFKIGW